MDYIPITITNTKNILIVALEVTVIKSRIVQNNIKVHFL